ncbi:DUF4435 domain-containing protein [Candidatus Halobeggiatoa sp. HSG11]|nr:DUF4435 domain-containing protein [Candidatus Halobeggiatoa sp. HSG11]
MSLVDNLRQQTQEPLAIWLQFITAYKNERYTLYIFFEGKTDGAYYLPELRRRRKQYEISQFICDGKDGVIEAYNDKRISKKVTDWKNVLFFVDRDLDELLNIIKIPQSSSFFVTDYYSIENYLVNNEILEMFWGDFYKLPSNENLNLVLQNFEHSRNIFVKLIRPMMAWAIIQKKKEQKLAIIQNRKVKGLNLNNVNLNKVFELELDSDLKPFKKKNGWKAFKKACAFEHQLNLTDFKQELKKLKSLEQKKYVRGKFELWYMVNFLTSLSNTLPSNKLKIQLTNENAIEILSGKIPYPQSLIDFLDYNLS